MSTIVYDLSLVVHFWLKSVMDLDYEIKLFVHLDRCAPIDASLRWNCIELRNELKRKKNPLIGIPNAFQTGFMSHI